MCSFKGNYIEPFALSIETANAYWYIYIALYFLTKLQRKVVLSNKSAKYPLHFYLKLHTKVHTYMCSLIEISHQSAKGKLHFS